MEEETVPFIQSWWSRAEGRVTGGQMSFTLQCLWSSLPADGPENSSHIAGNAAHSQKFCDSIYRLIAGAASNQDQLWLESEIFLSDWKI